MVRRTAPRMMADEFVLNRLATMKAQFDELTAKLEDPDIMADVTTLLKVNKDRSKLEPMVDALAEYKSLEVAMEEANEMFNEADDAEIKELARDEQREVEAQMSELDERLKLLLLPSDPNDEKNVMLEIRAVRRVGPHGTPHQVDMATS